MDAGVIAPLNSHLFCLQTVEQALRIYVTSEKLPTLAEVSA